jgi:LysM repeat protein
MAEERKFPRWMPHLWVVLLFWAAPAAAEKVKVTYTVKKGDTLLMIASRFNVDASSIEEWNKALFKKDAVSEAEGASPGAKKLTEDDFPKIIVQGTKLNIPKKDASGKWIVHEVKPGETFVQIARDYGVTKVKLLKWNKKLFGLADEPPKKKKKKPKCKTAKGKKSKGKCVDEGSAVIQVGMELVVFAERPEMGPRIGVYRCAQGDAPYAVAKKFKIKIQDFLDYNFALKSDRFDKNEVVEIPMPLPERLSLSVGPPEAGRLIGGERIPSFAYATSETITNLVNCIGEVQREFTGTHDMIVGHLSKKKGGKFPPHKSHTSGRDADVGYYLKGIVPGKFLKVTAENLDIDRTMRFVMCLADTRQVEYIFIDYYIQEILYAWMKKKNTFDSILGALIQFPRPIEKRLGLIRHEKGHDDHMHIRFVCPATSKNCYD